MFMYLSVIPDTDDRDNDTDHRHYNTDDTDYRFQHQILTFLLDFPFFQPPFKRWKSQNVLVPAKGEPLTAFGQHP